ncbi:hypothetical protein GCM10011504_46590 [Siccirubricoccus deserti]|uniref:Uncharacterized protein n=1 Tax=Siccirubricoccus deserti TaxID=2013562 RepID=A0A9X0UEX3_9PROT|nr:hypothetical protein [Siccirubricoccus deserti]MBC4018132.1 hypothetical protein [Siccirubricoccus deserti]GGC63075.1 hypothetical protein GCM10011504_46590 [Siccirubricoccus deserti]
MNGIGTALPGRTIAGVRLWAEDGAWLYLAEQPLPLLDANGRPQVSALEAAGMTMLSVGASLQPTEATMALLQQEVAQLAGPAAELHPAALTMRHAALEVAEAEGFAEIATARASDLPPQAAAFSAVLRDSRAATALAGLRGEAGRLRVLYRVALPRRRAATAALAGDLTNHLDGTGQIDAAGAEAAIRCAIETGDAKWSEQADPGASEELRRTVRSAAMAQAVQSLARTGTAGPGARTTVQAEATRTEAAPLTLELTADLAGWLGGG